MGVPVSKTGRHSVDMLHGPIFKSLVLFAIPVMISYLFQQLYNLVDTMIVSYYLGDSALAAMGATTSIYDTMIGFALGMGNGLSIITARSFGASDPHLLKRSVASALIIGLISSIAVSVLGLVTMRPLLELLQTPQDIIPDAYDYIATIVAFTIVMFAYNLFSGLLRAIGDSFMALVFLVSSSVLHILLCVLFITQFGMGVRGAAIATVISQGVSAVLCALYILKKTPLLVPDREHFKPDRRLYLDMTTQGLAMGFMQAIVAGGTVILQSGINTFGTLVIAGHTTARKIYMMFLTPFAGLGESMSTFVSQNRGAGQLDRIRKALRSCYICDLILAGVIAVILFLAAPTFVRLVSGSSEPVIIENASRYLWVVGPFYAVLGMLIQTRNSLQSLGDKINPTLSSFTELFCKVLFAFLLIPRFQYAAVIVCEPVIWCIMLLQVRIAYHFNKLMRGKAAP